MFTLARIWHLDCQATFLSSHFFNSVPLGLYYENPRTGYPSGRFEPQKSILRSSYAIYILVVRCIAQENHSACFEVEIASKLE